MVARVAIVTNADWYFWSHRLPIARAARDAGLEVLVIAGDERGYGPRIRAEGFRFIPLSIVRGSTRLADELATIRDLLRIYRHERPDLVHHVAVKPVLYGSIAARIARVPAVINAIAGQGFLANASGPKGVALRGITRVLYRIALGAPGSRTIFQNPDDLEAFVRAGALARSQTVLIRGSGVDLDLYAPSPEPMGVPLIVFASRLLWTKGLADLVDAKRRLDASGFATRLAIVGVSDVQNPDSISDEAVIEWSELGIAECWGLRSDMPAVLRGANLVVLPSTHGEGVPKILIEAAAAGRAIVATDVPGCREIVRDRINGLLVPPNNPARLAEAIRELLADQPLRRQMGEAGRAIACAEFGERAVVVATLSLYRELLSARTPLARQGAPV